MNLRVRLSVMYTLLMAALLLLLAVLVLGIMQRNLYAGVDRNLRDTYNQLARIAITAAPKPTPFELNGDSFGATGRSSDNLSVIRTTYPDYRVQLEPLIGYVLDDLQRRAAAGPQERAALVTELRRAMQFRSTPGVDPNTPIRLTDDQLLRLITSPDNQLLLNLPVKEAFESPVNTRVLVRLAPYTYAINTDGTGRDPLTIVYVGRSLEPTEQTLSTLQAIMLVLFAIGGGTAALGAYLAAGQALRPLTMLQRAAEQIGGKTLAQRVPVPTTRDEVQSLAHALNGMLDRLEDSFEAQRRFTSDASHELRTPVTAIQGHASYLLRRSNPNEQQRESLGIIKGESERLTLLISSLLELARSDSGVLQLRRAPIFAQGLLQSTVRELGPVSQAQGCELRAEGEEVVFEGDPDRLKQVILNLVSNAMKAGAPHITLSSRSELGPPPGAGTASAGARDTATLLPGLRLSVQDDGPGIAAEHLERLFDRFYRVEESRSRDQGGAGLGLAIVRGIVDAHQGRIWIESEPGRGTAVHVWLPLGDLPELDDDVA